MTVCLYIRLSDSDGDLKFKAESGSVSSQRELLRQFVADRREFDGADIEEYVDDGYTGTNGERPSFERMIAKLEEIGPATVICKDFSRFFRDYTEIGDYLERVFPLLGVRFISVNDRYDSDDYKGTTAGMEVVMQCVIYSWYSRDLSQKVRAANEARIRRGEYIGATPPFGYQKDPHTRNHMVLDPESSLVVRRIFDMAISGMDLGAIARRLNKDSVETPSAYLHRKHPENRRYERTSPEQQWSRDAVHCVLTRLEYTGAVVGNRRNWKGIYNPHTSIRDRKDWIVVPNRHDAIVTREEYDKAQLVIHSCKQTPHNNKDYLLRSLVRCGICGRVMRRSRSKRAYYCCWDAKFAVGTRCPTGEKFYEDEIEWAVTDSFRTMVTLFMRQTDIWNEAEQKTAGSVASMKNRLAQIGQRKKQIHLIKMDLYEQYNEGKTAREKYLREKDALTAEQENLDVEKGEIEESLSSMPVERDAQVSAMEKDARQFLEDGVMTNDLLRCFIERVDVYSGMRIEIKYRFSDPLMEEMMKLETTS